MAASRLEDGDRLPTLTAHVVGNDDDQMTLPDDLAGSWALLVFYRGHW